MNKLKKFFLVIPLLLLIIVNIIIFIKYYNDFEKLENFDFYNFSLALFILLWDIIYFCLLIKHYKKK